MLFMSHMMWQISITNTRKICHNFLYDKNSIKVIKLYQYRLIYFYILSLFLPRLTYLAHPIGVNVCVEKNRNWYAQKNSFLSSQIISYLKVITFLFIFYFRIIFVRTSRAYMIIDIKMRNKKESDWQKLHQLVPSPTQQCWKYPHQDSPLHFPK